MNTSIGRCRRTECTDIDNHIYITTRGKIIQQIQNTEKSSIEEFRRILSFLSHYRARIT